MTKRKTNRAIRSDSQQHLPCVVEGCEATRVAKGKCHKHWKVDYLAAKTPEERQEFVQRANGHPEPTRPRPAACECCGKVPESILCLDHDHATHEFRGWLCYNCNRGIGCLGDDIDGLTRALAYLFRTT